MGHSSKLSGVVLANAEFIIIDKDFNFKMNKSVIWLTVFILMMQMASLASARELWQRNIWNLTQPEYKELYAATNKVHNQEIKPLNIWGKTLYDAINALMVKGYSCSLFDGASVSCNTYTQEEFCHEVAVMFLVEDISRQQSIAELAKRLDTAKALVPTTLCDFPVYLPQTYATHQKEAEAKFGEVAKEFPLEGKTGKEALETMLAAGYTCGILLDEAKVPKLSCSYCHTQIKYCYDANIQMEMTWPQPSCDRANLLKQLDTAVVKKVESRCLIPNLQPQPKD